MNHCHARRLAAIAPLFCSLMAGGLARAQDDAPVYVPATVGEAEVQDGLEWRMNAGATFNLSDNRSVIGQPDGSTWTFGYMLDVGADYRNSGHEWRNLFGFAAGLTKTPNIDELVKARDNAQLETIYLYHIIKWLGPFARFAADTAAFPGTDIRGEPTTYQIARVDGTTDTVLAPRLRLTDSFRPMRLKESAGAFVQPLQRDYARIELRAGAGARQTFAADQLAIDDDDTTPVIEVKELTDVQQVGFEGVLDFKGEALEKKLSYYLGVEVLVPFYYSDLAPGDDRGIGDLTNVEIKTGASFKVVSWASLDYQFNALREPLLLDQWQIRNNVLLTFAIAAGNVKKEEAPAE